MKDTSPFQCVIEFKAPDGRQVRAVERGGGIYSVYVQRQSAAFVHEKMVTLPGDATPAQVLAALDAE